MSLASARPFLGRFPVPRRKRVLFLSAESGLGKLQLTAKLIGKKARIHWEQLQGWFEIRTQAVRFVDKGALAEFKQYIEQKDFEVVIIDPAYLCMDGESAGNLFLMGSQLGAIANVCAGRTLIIAHHTKQVQQRFVPPQLEDLAWAGFKEFARQWILLARRAQYVPGTGQHELHMTVGGSAGHGGQYQLNIDDGTATGNWNAEFLDARASAEHSQSDPQ